MSWIKYSATGTNTDAPAPSLTFTGYKKPFLLRLEESGDIN